jgi:hypothetical protein
MCRATTLWLFAITLMAASDKDQVAPPIVMTVCQIVSAAAEYDGKEVAAKGVYWRTVHGAVLSAPECRDAKVNISFGAKVKGARADMKTLGRLADAQETADVAFRGVFRMAHQGQCFGQDCYPYQIQVDDVLQVRRHQRE